jgi:phosphoglycolate phosphatase
MLWKRQKMNSDIELFIFDLDGTLVDSRKDLGAAINHIITSCGFDPLTEAEVMEFVGNGVPSFLANLAGGDDGAKFEIFRHYLEYLDTHLLDTTVPFPGVLETLSRITKRKAVVTNKLTHMAERVIQHVGLKPYIELVVGSDTASRMKPDPAPVLHAVGQCGADISRVVMVGDTGDDIRAATAAGVIPCGVTYGFGKREDLIGAGAKIIIEHFAELDSHFR